MKKFLLCLIFSLFATNCWGAFQSFTGTYTGNNTDDRNITGIGFQPDWVLIISDTAQQPVMWTSANGTDATQYIGPNSFL